MVTLSTHRSKLSKAGYSWTLSQRAQRARPPSPDDGKARFADLRRSRKLGTTDLRALRIAKLWAREFILKTRRDPARLQRDLSNRLSLAGKRRVMDTVSRESVKATPSQRMSIGKQAWVSSANAAV